MEKIELLTELKAKIASGEISREEVLGSLPGSEAASTSVSRHLNLSEILYYIGGGIVLLGIVVLCFQNWESFTSPVRILVTFGSFVATLVVATLLDRYDHLRKVSQAFFLIAGVLAPLGCNVLLHEMGVRVDSNYVQLFIFVALSLLFAVFFWLTKQTLNLFFVIAFASVVVYVVVNILAGENLRFSDQAQLYQYVSLGLGLCYMLLGYYIKNTNQASLSGVLYFFGSNWFLLSAIMLGGWKPDQNAFWELVYPLLVFGIIFLSVYIKSKSFLVFGTLYLIAYILKLTGEYFQDSLGWPLALVLAGLLIMLVGYYAVRINKKYISQAAAIPPAA